MHAFRMATIDDDLHLQCLHWICHGGCPIFIARVILKSYRGRSNGVLRRVKRPIECGPSAIACVLSLLCWCTGVPSGTSNTYRSLLLAVSSSTINTPSGYMILKLSPFAITASFVRTLPNSLNCDQDQIQDSAVVGTYRSFPNS